MSEEKPVLKVTDRRLFNPDGTPREGVERETPQPPKASTDAAAAPSSAKVDDAANAAFSASATQANAASPAASVVGAQTVADSGRVPNAASDTPPQELSGMAAGAADSNQSTGRAAATEDPTAFVNLLMFIASPAAASLGLTEHPGMGADEIDLPLAKHCIDLLGTLRHKSQGNLSAQENEIFENLLAELRMQFVSLSSSMGSGAGGQGNTVSGAGGGFSGSDITGGR